MLFRSLYDICIKLFNMEKREYIIILLKNHWDVYKDCVLIFYMFFRGDLICDVIKYDIDMINFISTKQPYNIDRKNLVMEKCFYMLKWPLSIKFVFENIITDVDTIISIAKKLSRYEIFKYVIERFPDRRNELELHYCKTIISCNQIKNHIEDLKKIPKEFISSAILLYPNSAIEIFDIIDFYNLNLFLNFRLCVEMWPFL